MNAHASPRPAESAALPHFLVQQPTRERILVAARALLRTHGYAGFSMERVALECGLTRRTLYNQFADRDALYQASRAGLLDEFEHRLPREIVTVSDPPIAIERFLSTALGVLSRGAHIELARSAACDEWAYPWVTVLYEDRVRSPLRDAVERYLATLERLGAAGRAADLVAMLLAAVKGAPHAPVFTPSELAGIFLRRLDTAPTL